MLVEWKLNVALTVAQGFWLLKALAPSASTASLIHVPISLLGLKDASDQDNASSLSKHKTVVSFEYNCTNISLLLSFKET